MLHETLPHLHRAAAALTLVAANYAAAFAQGNWIILVRRVVFHCQNLHSSRIVAEFFRARALRRRLTEQHGVWEEEKEKRRQAAIRCAAFIASAARGDIVHRGSF